MITNNKVFNIELPYWQGVVSEPGATPITLPFSVAKDEDGLYKQINLDTINKIIEKYSSDEYRHISTPPGESSWGDKIANQNIEYTRKNVDLKGKRILDIAGVSSYIADILFEEDEILSYTLINPNFKNDVKISKMKCIKGYFPEAITQDEKFDVVLLFNCLEHVPNPQEFLSSIKNVLTEDGVLILKIPNVTRLFKQGDFSVFLHEHIFYFTAETFTLISEKAGMGVANMCLDDDGIMATLKHLRVQKKIDIKIPDFDLSKFNSQIEYSKNLFKKLMQNNTKFIFHGAALGLVTLAHLVKDEIDLSNVQVVDIDENKHGKYLPLYKLPIKSPEEIDVDSVDLIISGSTIFLNPIINYWTKRGLRPKNIITFIDI